MTAPTRAVFTALIGRYEPLTEQPVAVGSATPFICFTDDPDLRSETWDVRVVDPLLALDPTRSARALKITGHPDLAAFDETLWVDARVRLTADPAAVLGDWLDGADVAAPRHSFRTDVVTEFEEVLLAGLDDSSRLYEQLTHYTTLAPQLLEAPVAWTALLARRQGPTVDRAMEEWLLHVLRYSRRDQLSFAHTLAATGVTPRLVDLDNLRSEVHEWLGVGGRDPRPAILRVADSLRPPTAKLGELRRQLERATFDMTAAVSAREQRIAELEAVTATLQERVEVLQARSERKQQRIREMRGQLNAERRRP